MNFACGWNFPLICELGRKAHKEKEKKSPPARKISLTGNQISMIINLLFKTIVIEISMVVICAKPNLMKRFLKSFLTVMLVSLYPRFHVKRQICFAPPPLAKKPTNIDTKLPRME